MLEKEFGWSGLLVEPQSKLMPTLYAHRGNANNHILNACVYNRTYLASFIDISSTAEYTSNHGFGEDMLSGVVDSWAWKSKGWIDEDSPTIQVPCYDGQSVLDAHNITHVHYLSVDAEGADEIILRSFDWTRFSADVISLEYVNAETYYSIERFFYDLGYAHVELSGHDALFFREWRHYPGVLDVARARQQQEGSADYQTPMRMTPAAAAAAKQQAQEQS
jgi:FkbM family methyltransferase